MPCSRTLRVSDVSWQVVSPAASARCWRLLGRWSASRKVLMLDEPSAGLSPKLVGIVFEKLVEVRATGVTIVLVEQNVKAALAIADRAAVLVEGSTRVVGTARELANDPQVAALYLGHHRGDT